MRKTMKIFAVLACLSIGLTASVAGASAVTASAESLVSAEMQMESGASLYLNPESEETGKASDSGLKFSYSIGNDTLENTQSYGMLIVQYDYLDNAGITDLTNAENDYVTALNKAYEEKKISYATIIAENLTPSSAGVVDYSIRNLNEYNYTRSFFGIGFKATTVGDTTTYTYATQHANGNVRSVFEVANLALNNLHDEAAWDSTNQEKKVLLQKYETVLATFLTTGFEFVYGTQTPTIEVSANTVNGEVTPTITTEKVKAIDLGMHWNYTAADTEVATVNGDKIKGESRGQTTLTASLGGAIEVKDIEMVVLKDATEVGIYNNSGKADFFAEIETNKNSYSTVSLVGGNFRTSSAYTQDTGYTAFTNPNAEDGKYTLDENGTYVDFYFTGNNMPNVEFFANTISASMWNDGSNTGFVVNNGHGPGGLYDNYATAKDLINTTDYSNLSTSFK